MKVKTEVWHCQRPCKGEKGKPACARSYGLYCPLVAASYLADAGHKGGSWRLRYGSLQKGAWGGRAGGVLVVDQDQNPLIPCLLFRLEPKFVKVFWIPESENPDDDKIYFFFRESAVEAAPAMGRMTVSRVGQICRVWRH